MGEFFLSERAAKELRTIFDYSEKMWGRTVADDNLRDIFTVHQLVSEDPERGIPWKHRSLPFLMHPSGKHFVVYEHLTSKSIAVITILHGNQNIEKILDENTLEFKITISNIRSKFFS